MKWEYGFFYLKSGLLSRDEHTQVVNEELNALGDEGWELVHVSESGCAYFKRPKDEGGAGAPAGGDPKAAQEPGADVGGQLGARSGSEEEHN
jgi:hypothetical protein